MPRADCYISIDVEADGPIPGPFSMVSFGMVVAGVYDGMTFTPTDPSADTFYRELCPISEEYDAETLAVTRLDRDWLVANGQSPAAAMSEAAAWVKRMVRRRRPVAVAYPLAFDWMWLYWYFTRFAESGSPFGFSSCLDMKTMYVSRARTVVSAATKSQMPSEVLSTRRHVHHGLADAIEQAEMFQKLFQWWPQRDRGSSLAQRQNS